MTFAVKFTQADSTINLTAMADVNDENREFIVIEFIDYAIVTNADAPSLAAGQLLDSCWTRIYSKFSDGGNDALLFRYSERIQVFLGATQNGNRVGHDTRFFFNSLTACSKGIATSRRALARS